VLEIIFAFRLPKVKFEDAEQVFVAIDRLCATPVDGNVCPFLSIVTSALQLSLKWTSFCITSVATYFPIA